MTTADDTGSDTRTPAPAFRDQRPPAAGTHNRPPVPRSALRRARSAATNKSLVYALGWLSVGLGVVEARAATARARDRLAPRARDRRREDILREPPQACYDLWRNVENLPRFMKRLVSVINP